MFFKSPKLIMELYPNQGKTRLQIYIQYSPKNDTSLPMNRPEAMCIYEFEWKFDLMIRNNSEVTAYSTQILQRVNKPELNFKLSLNINKAIQPHQEIKLPQVFSKVDTMHFERELHYVPTPSAFSDLLLLLKYENEYGLGFYSKYNFKTDRTDLKDISLSEMEINP